VSKAKNKAGNGHIPEGKQLVKCQYPPCVTNIVIDKITPGMPYKGPPPFCKLHLEMLQFYMWCVSTVKVEQQRTPGGVILPGNKQYEATLNKEDLFNQRVTIK